MWHKVLDMIQSLIFDYLGDFQQEELVSQTSSGMQW
jgi:hypothetical protein